RPGERVDALGERHDLAADLLRDLDAERFRREGKGVLSRADDQNANGHPRASAINSAAPRDRSLRATASPRLSGSSADPRPSSRSERSPEREKTEATRRRRPSLGVARPASGARQPASKMASSALSARASR